MAREHIGGGELLSMEQLYLQTSGQFCPVCIEDALDRLGYEETGVDTISRLVICRMCGSSFWEVFNIVGITNLQKASEEVVDKVDNDGRVI